MRRMRTLLLAMAAALPCGTALAQTTPAQQGLPALHADGAQISVSGLSSGGFMAVQFHTAYSARVMGVGVVAAGPYDCAYSGLPLPVDPVDNPWLAEAGTQACMTAAPVAPDGALSAGKARQFAGLGRIDGVDNLARSRVYIFSGTEDRKVVPAVVAATRGYYLTVGVPAGQIQYVHDIPAGHGFITPDFGASCGRTVSPYINHCTFGGRGYDQAGAILSQIYGPLNPPAAAPTGHIVAFDQAPYGGTSLGPMGYLYVPRACAQGASCRVHVAFHGCLQTPQDIGDKFYTDTGYNRWADSNNILVLYPQAPTDLPLNPDHCWDWWGYTGPDFDAKAGPQMRAVSRMLDRLTE